MPTDALTADALTTELVMLELELQSAEARANAHRLAQLLHPSYFVEVTRAGLHEQTASTPWPCCCRRSNQRAQPHAQDFQLREPRNGGLALLTYQSAHLDAAGPFRGPHLTHCSLVAAQTTSGWQTALPPGHAEPRALWSGAA